MKHHKSLLAIGLTRLEAEVYLNLYAQKMQNATAREITAQLNGPRSGVYRALKHLETYGFVTRSRIIAVTSFRARPLNHALVDYADWQRQQVHELLIQQA